MYVPPQLRSTFDFSAVNFSTPAELASAVDGLGSREATGCACRFVGGAETLHTPPSLTTSAAAPPCFVPVDPQDDAVRAVEFEPTLRIGSKTP